MGRWHRSRTRMYQLFGRTGQKARQFTIHNSQFTIHNSQFTTVNEYRLTRPGLFSIHCECELRVGGVQGFDSKLTLRHAQAKRRGFRTLVIENTGSNCTVDRRQRVPLRGRRLARVSAPPRTFARCTLQLPRLYWLTDVTTSRPLEMADLLG
jgi:hypothetical protein